MVPRLFVPRRAPLNPVASRAQRPVRTQDSAKFLDRADVANLAQATRKATFEGHVRRTVAVGERLAGTSMLLATMSGLGTHGPVAAGIMLAGFVLDLHAMQTARCGRKLLDTAVDLDDLGKTIGKPAHQIDKQEALLRESTQQSEARERAASVVEAYGRSSLARMALFPDKSYVFSAGGSVVPYALAGRTAMALGDPIGPREDFSAALKTYLDHCKRHHWQPAFYQVSGEHVDGYRAAGLVALPVGDEGIVDTKSFSLAGGRNKNLRAVVNKFRKSGFTAAVHEGPLTDELLGELRKVSDAWLTTMHGKEKGFSLGAFDDNYVREGPVMVVRTPTGEISAFVNLVPRYQENGVAVDLMRRVPAAANSTMDFLFTSLFEWARDRGYDNVSLGLSPLAGVGDKRGDPLPERVVHFIYEHANQFYNFKGLHAFKEKFNPEWSTRYLICSNVGALAGAGLALVKLNSGNDFVGDVGREMLTRVRQKLIRADAVDGRRSST